MHGEMVYMARNIEKRIDPISLVPKAKSIVTVLLHYFTGNHEISTTPPKISRYALSADYHTTMKGMLWAMLEKLRHQFGEVNGRAFVDSAPVLERAWAMRSGLGWIGKNSLLIHPKMGSYVFIGELIVDREIEPSIKSVPNHCGNCTRCIDACPAGAILAPMIIDSRKCISYLTIEKKSPLSQEEVFSLNGWCFGCDICQEVCPWNHKLPIGVSSFVKPIIDTNCLNTIEVVNSTEADFNHKYSNTPIARTGLRKFTSSVVSSKP